jgi:hypothetical protein
VRVHLENVDLDFIMNLTYCTPSQAPETRISMIPCQCRTPPLLLVPSTSAPQHRCS